MAPIALSALQEFLTGALHSMTADSLIHAAATAKGTVKRRATARWTAKLRFLLAGGPPIAWHPWILLIPLHHSQDERPARALPASQSEEGAFSLLRSTRAASSAFPAFFEPHGLNPIPLLCITF